MSKCDAVLLARTVKVDALRYQQDLAWMKLVNQSNYEQAKTEIGAVVPGYFDGNYDTFAAKRDQLSSQEWFTRSENMVRTQFLALAPDEGIRAWRDCTLANSAGGAVLIGYMREVNDENAILHLEWSPAEGTVGPLRKTRLIVQGATIEPPDEPDGFSSSWITAVTDKGFTGAVRILLKRTGADHPIMVTASGKVKAGAVYPVSLEYKPPAPPPEVALYSRKQDFGAAPGTLDVDVDPYRDRLLDIYVRYESNYETPGDPYFGLRVKVDGAQQFYLRQGSQRVVGNGVDVISTRSSGP